MLTKEMQKLQLAPCKVYTYYLVICKIPFQILNISTYIFLNPLTHEGMEHVIKIGRTLPYSSKKRGLFPGEKSGNSGKYSPLPEMWPVSFAHILAGNDWIFKIPPDYAGRYEQSKIWEEWNLLITIKDN